MCPYILHVDINSEFYDCVPLIFIETSTLKIMSNKQLHKW